VATEERVVLTAEMRDELSAPLTDLDKKVDSTSKGIEKSAKQQAKATERSSKKMDTAMDKAGKSANAMESVFQKVSRSKPLSGLVKGVESARKKIGAATEKISDETKDNLKTGFAAAGVAAAGALTAGLVGALGKGAGNDKITASLGLSPKQAKRAGKASGRLYAGAYGESLADVNTAVESVMSSIKGMRTGSASEIEKMTAKVLTMSKTFEVDAGRAAQVAGQMINSGLAKNGTQAADLLTTAMQKVPSAVREDILDAADEYGPFFANLGLSGEKAMGMLVASSEKGMYGIDKTGDAVKEFGIRATDMSKASGAAYETLGFDQQKMTNKLLKGGETGSKAFQKIVGGLQDIKDPAKRSEAAIALFGTPLEDLSVNEIPQFLTSLQSTKTGLGEVAGASKRMGDTVRDNATTRLKEFKRIAIGAFTGLAEQAIPVLEPVLTFLQKFAPILAPTAVGIVAVGLAIKGASVAMGIFNAVMKMNPVVRTISLIVVAVTALVAGVMWAYNNVEWFRDAVDAAFSWIKKSVSVVVNWFMNTALPVLLKVWDGIAAGATWLWQNIISPVFRFIGGAIRAFWMLASGIFKLVVAFIRLTLGPVFSWLYEKVIKPVFGWIGDRISKVWKSKIKPVFQTLGDFITDTVAPAFQKGVELVGKAWGMVKSIAAKPISFVIDTVINKGIIGAFNWVAKKLGVDTLPEVHNPLKNVKASAPAVSGGPMRAFAEGGYTGHGGKYEPAGIVHKGEYVVNKAQTKAAGGPAAIGAALNGGGGFAPIWGPFQNAIRSAGRLFVGTGAGPAWQIPAAASMWDQLAGIRVQAGSGHPQASTGLGALGSILAWATGSGNITFNTQGIAPGLSPGMKRATAAHEIGHVLGLPHTNASSIMQPIIGNHMAPTAFDVGRLRSLYGKGSRGAGEGGGFNPLGWLVDKVKDAMAGLLDNIPGLGMFADLAAGVGKKLISGVTDWVGDKLGIGGSAAKAGFAAPGIYDNGGMLAPGAAGINLGRKPEAVLDPEETANYKAMFRNDGGQNAGGDTITINATINVTGEVEDEYEVKRKFTEMLEEAFADANRRKY